MKTSTPQQPKKPEPLKLLLMGEPGSRKTWLSLQFPDVHIYDCDQNLDGAERGLRKGFDRDKIAPIALSYTYDVIRRDSSGNALDTEKCFDSLMNRIADFKDPELFPELNKRRTFVVDSLSHVNEFIVRKVLKLKGKELVDINIWMDFASNAYTILVGGLDYIRTFDKPIICTCHLEKVSESEEKNIMKKKVIEVNPLFSGRVGDSIGGLFTDVWMLEKRAGLADTTKLMLMTDRTSKCSHLKNSVGMPPELDVTQGFKVIKPYLIGRI